MAEQKPQQQPQQLTEEQAQAWVREKFQEANKYLAEQGILSDQIVTKESRYLIPYIAVWKFTTQDKKKVWVVNGDVPTDLVGEKAAKTPREALRHFALSWQLKADKVLADEKSLTTEKQNYAKYLIARAENVYQVTEREDLWQQD